MIKTGPYVREKASELKIRSGSFPGHGRLKPPPPEARVGHGLYDGDRWVGFVELTYPYLKGLDKTKAYVGVGLLPEYRGKGLALPVVQDLISQHPEVKKWVWSHVPENKASSSLGKRLGFSGGKAEGPMVTMEKTAGDKYLHLLQRLKDAGW